MTQELSLLLLLYCMAICDSGRDQRSHGIGAKVWHWAWRFGTSIKHDTHCTIIVLLCKLQVVVNITDLKGLRSNQSTLFQEKLDPRDALQTKSLEERRGKLENFMFLSCNIHLREL